MIIISIIRNILVRVGADIQPFSQGMTSAQASLNHFQTGMTTATNRTRSSVGAMGSALGKLGGIVAAAFAVTKIVEFGKSSVALASNLNEVQNVVDVTFGGMSNQINNFAKNAITQFGISELSAKKFGSTMGAMLKSSGITGQQLTNMSEGVTGLAGDMASFYNLDPQTAFDKIRAGIAGETEPLRQLGINMSVANMEAYALATGIKTKYAAMDQASQSLLRYNYLMSVSKDAQGDFARTSGSWANQVRLLSQQWDIMKTTLGQGFINMFTPLLSVINSLIAKLQVAAGWFKALTETIWGSAGAVTGIVISTDGSTDGIDAIGTSADKTGASVKKAAASIKGSLGSFDQLNTLSKSTGAADGSGGGGAGGEATVSVTKASDVAIPDIKLPSWIESLKSISFQPLMDSLGRLKTALEPFTNTLFAGMQWLYTNVLVPFGTFVIQDYLPAFFNELAGAATILNPLLLSFKPLAEWLWTSFLQPIATWTGGVIVSALNGVGDALTKIGTWMSSNQSVVTGFTEAVVGFMAAWAGVEILAFVQMSGGVIAALKNISTAIKGATLVKLADKLVTMELTAMYAKDLVVSLAAGTLGFLKQTAQVALSNITMAAHLLATGAYSVATGIATAATTAFGVALDIAIGPVGLTIAALALLGLGIYELVKHWDKVKEVGASTWAAIKGVWTQASGWFGDHVVNPIKNLFSGLWDGVGNIFKGIANTMIDALNFIIRGMNKIHFDIPSWVPGFLGGGKGFGINIAQIPHLANGGLASKPTLALVGDNKNAYSDPEVISPLSKLQTMIDKSLSNAMGSGGRGNDGGDLVIKVGESEFARISIRSINNYQRQAGQTLLMV